VIFESKDPYRSVEATEGGEKHAAVVPEKCGLTLAIKDPLGKFKKRELHI
jgi:hypothetical protein